jgi:hypothetical protein
MESARHLWLKRKSLGWLHRSGWVAAATEVSLPVAKFRADVAGWCDREGNSRTIVVECKASRADFLRDSKDVRDLLERRRVLHDVAKRAGIRPASLTRERYDRHRAGARGLFDAVNGDFDTMPARDLRRMRLQLLAINRRLHAGAKFAHLAWWRAADELWVATGLGLLRRDAIPTGWGLLEFDRMGEVRIRIQAPQLGAADRWRARLLRSIAVASTRDACKAIR